MTINLANDGQSVHHMQHVAGDDNTYAVDFRCDSCQFVTSGQIVTR
jgi:hypothetical protein